MATALLDNATLTGVQRIVGTAPSRSLDSVDVDLMAYENYVEARLFYDDVVVVDDYKSAFRPARRAAFPCVNFLDTSEFGIKELAEEADRISRQIRPKIQGGDFADADLKELLELLQLHMVCTWDISSSVYHLTLKVLADEGSEEFQKYGTLATALFQELNEAKSSGDHRRPSVDLVDRHGKPIRGGYSVPGAKWSGAETGPPTAALTAFVGALVWLSNRAIFYTLASAQLKADSFLYPMRQAYQQYYLAKTLRFDADFPKRLVDHLSETLSRDIVDVLAGGTATATAIDLPIFSAWLVNRCRDSLAALDELETVRRKQEFVDAREQIAELRELYEEKDLARSQRHIKRLQEGLSRISANMRQKFGVETPQGVPLTRLVRLYNSAALLKGLPQMPEIEAKVKLPHFLTDIRRPVGVSAIYRSAMNDLSVFSRLGNIRDVLGRRVAVDKDAYAYQAKAESPKFRHSHSGIKSPM